MNSNKQRGFVMMLALVAGATASAAFACPPDETGGSPDPSQEIRTIELPGGGSVRMMSSKARIKTTDGDHLVTLYGHPQGSTLETRVYKPGEAAAIYGLQPATGSNAVRIVRVVKDGHDVRVEQRGGKITAKIDGKEVPADNVSVKDGSIEVRDADGKTVLKEEWPEIESSPALPGRFGTLAVPPVPPVAPVPPGITWTGPAEIETPKVMLGITMDEADEDAVAQLGLPEGDYAVIATVPEGLPAAKAGLKPKDIIVSVDGKTPASALTIRDVMKTKNAGDKLAVEVARKGSRVKVDVPLEAFDGNRFGAYAKTMGQQSRQWQSLTDKIAKDPLSGENVIVGIPRGQNGEPLLLRDRNAAEQKALEARLSALESQLKRLEQMLKRMESRGEDTLPPSGGGGAPKPLYSAGI